MKGWESLGAAGCGWVNLAGAIGSLDRVTAVTWEPVGCNEAARRRGSSEGVPWDAIQPCIPCGFPVVLCLRHFYVLQRTLQQLSITVKRVLRGGHLRFSSDDPGTLGVPWAWQ